jgi:hypothetical protein
MTSEPSASVQSAQATTPSPAFGAVVRVTPAERGFSSAEDHSRLSRRVLRAV